MYLVQFDKNENEFYTDQEAVYFLGNELNAEEFAAFEFGEIVDEEWDKQYLIPLTTLAEFENFQEECNNALITADTTIDELNQFFPRFNNTIGFLVIYVKDFKDGRTFSLIRHLRNLGYQQSIVIAGDYGLDQAAYYYKSGATGFFVKDEQLTTLKKTLDDLKSGHFGNSANALPMFQ